MCCLSERHFMTHFHLGKLIDLSSGYAHVTDCTTTLLTWICYSKFPSISLICCIDQFDYSPVHTIVWYLIRHPSVWSGGQGLGQEMCHWVEWISCCRADEHALLQKTNRGQERSDMNMHYYRRPTGGRRGQAWTCSTTEDQRGSRGNLLTLLLHQHQSLSAEGSAKALQ